MKVERCSIFHSPSQTPKLRPTSPVSLSRRNGSLRSRAQARLRSGVSAEMPMTSALSAANFAASSRYRENSVPHPLVNAFG